MKPRNSPQHHLIKKHSLQITPTILAGTIATLLWGLPSAKAASATWNGTTDGLWATGTNWSATPVPGVGDTATFNNAGNGNTTITVGNISLLSLLFNTAGAAAYTLGSGSISLGSAGNFTVNSTVTTTQTVNTTLALNGGYTFTNNSTAGGQSLSIGGGISSATAGTKTLTVNGAGNTTISGNISNGSGGIGLTKNGAGTLTLSGTTNSIIGGDFAIGTSGNGGTVRIASGASVTTTTTARLLVGLNTGQSGTFTMDAGAGTVTFGGNRGSVANYIGVDGGTGTVNVNGGTLNFTGMANGSGHVLIGANGGTSNGTMTVAGGTVNVGTRIQMGSGYPGDGAVGWAANGNGNATLTISSGAVNIGTAGAGDTDSDKGFLYLKSPTGGTGTATVNLDGGTLSLAKFQIGAGGTSRVVNFNGGTVQARASRTDFLGTGATLNVKDNGAIIDSNTFDITIAGNLVNGGTGVGGLTKNSAGTLTLTGTNTYGGATAIKSGTLALGVSNDRLPTGTTVTLGDSVTNTNGILKLDSRSQQLAGLLTAGSGTGNRVVNGNAAAATLTLNIASGTNTFGGILGGGGTNENNFALTKSGNGTLTLTNANTLYTGATTITGGTLAFSGGGTLAASAAITVASGATLRFDRNDTFGNHATAVSQTITVNGGTIANGGNFFTTLGAVTLNGGTINSTGGAVPSFPSFSLRGPITVGGSAASTISGSGPNSQMVVGGNTAGTQTTFDVANATGDALADLTVSVPLQDNRDVANSATVATGIIKTGVGTMTLSGANTYTGGTTITTGTLQVDGSTAAGSTVGIGTAGTLSGSGTINGNATLTGSGIINKSAGTIAGTLGVTGGNWNGAGTVTGAVTSSSGTFTIASGANLTATAGVSATGGALVVNGTLTGTLVANTSTTISGTGTITGNATIQGTHNPGNSPGIQTYGANLAYTGGASVVNWELTNDTVSNLANPNAIFDQIIVGGNLDFTNLTTINLIFNGAGSGVAWGDALWTTDQSWTLYDVTGTTTNLGNLNLTTINWLDGSGIFFDTLHPDGGFSLSQSGNDVLLNYAAIPEPNVTALLGGLGILSLLRRRRK